MTGFLLFKRYLLFVFFVIVFFSCNKKDNADISPESNVVIYTANQDGNIFAVDANTGQQKWVFKSYNTIYSSPIVSNGVLYIGTNNGNLYAVNAATGQEKWTVDLNDWVVSSPIVVNKTVYVGSSDGYFYAIDSDTGAIRWKFPAIGIYSSPAVANGLVYFGSFDKNIYALDATTGKLKWKFTSTDEVHGSPILQDGVLYIANGMGKFYALDAITGQQKWTIPINSFYSGNTASIMNSLAFLISGGDLLAIELNTGKQKWAHNFTTSPNPVIASLNGLVYVQSAVYIKSTGNSGNDQIYATKLYAIEAETGLQKWAFNSSNQYNNRSYAVLPSPTAINGSVYLVSQDGYLYSLDAVTGEKKWSFNTGGYIWGSPCVVTSQNKVHRGLGEIHL